MNENKSLVEFQDNLPFATLNIKHLELLSSVDSCTLEHWKLLLSTFTIICPDSLLQEQNLEMSIQNISTSLLVNNKQSHNFNTILLFLLGSMKTHRMNAYHGEWQSQTFNALFLLRVFIKHFIEAMNTHQIQELFEMDRLSESSTIGLPKISNFPVDEKILLDKRFRSEVLVEELLQALIYSDTKTEMNYNFYIQLINLLIILFSGQMMQDPNSNDETLFMKIAMDSLCHFSRSVVARLFKNFLEQQPNPKKDNGYFSAAYTLFFSSNEKSTDNNCQLSDKSIMLLLILCNQSPLGLSNEYRNVLSEIEDLESSTALTDTVSVRISFRNLLEVICSSLSHEESTLLLYLTLLKNREFGRFMRSKSDQGLLIIPILQIIYQSIENRENYSRLYTLLTIILVLTQDELFNESLHHINILAPSWLTEKTFSNVSLGGLIILVLIRAIQANLAKHRDAYIHVNCLAIIGNLSTSIVSISCVVAQKFITLFEAVAKRYWKLCENNKTTENEFTDQKSAYSEILSLILEVINSIMIHNLQHNPQLIYALLHASEIFYKFRLEPRFSDLIENIDTVLTHFHSKILSMENKSPTADEVYEIIQESATAWSTGKLKLFSELKFQYEESQEYSRFFLPYIWSLVHKHSLIYWDEDKLLLLKELDMESPYTL